MCVRVAQFMHRMVRWERGRYDGLTMKFPKIANKQKNGASLAFPDVCKVPAPPAPFVPVPFPNVSVASDNLSKASKRVKILQKEATSVKSSSGDEPGTLKGIVSSMTKMSTLFAQHSVKVKAEGKKASLLGDAKMANKAYTTAAKLQKDFEKKLEAECKKLTDACKADPEQEKIAKKVIDLVGKAARGHKI